ncbi:hypothetical protein AMK59_2953 [Oryctes borbonicus]|uniref:Transposable element P transposase-like GTP-binding insertion domain-containing protein n=1 Tax=Oryctes borbonicus TaxID=1629725 RepID=A0A0T6BFP3_9SCAR|nr:hypothetical protein AMK59_2953 [Oryctes borbonicus]
MRNNLLKYDLAFATNNIPHTSSWKHIIQVYMEDKEKDIRAVPKLTDFHIHSETVKKMNVEYCTQVFTQRVASQMMVWTEYASGDFINVGARSTARLINFLNQLFDSLNAGEYFVSGKPLKCALQNNTEHIELWKKSVNILKSMFLIKDDSKFGPLTIKNWISTIESVLLLWRHLNGQEVFKYL